MGVSSTEWDHLKSGGRYRIIGFCIIENGLVPAVLYRKAGSVDETFFVRPCEEFFDGRFVPVSRDPEPTEEPAKSVWTGPLDATGKVQITMESVVYFKNDQEKVPYLISKIERGGVIHLADVQGSVQAHELIVDHEEPRSADTLMGRPINWDALGDEFEEGIRVEDSQGTKLQVGDWVRLEEEYSEHSKLWPHTNPLTPAQIKAFDGYAFVQIDCEEAIQSDVVIPANALRFVKRQVGTITVPHDG